jgi:hypothetical protein
MNRVDEISKEFYAQYGLVMHTIQTIEKGLLILYALWEYRENNISKIEYLKILAKPLALGTLKDKMVKNEIFDESAADELNRINQIRRFLAHNFWWERNLEFTNPKQLRLLHLEIMSYLATFQCVLIRYFRKVSTSFTICFSHEIDYW